MGQRRRSSHETQLCQVMSSALQEVLIYGSAVNDVLLAFGYIQSFIVSFWCFNLFNVAAHAVFGAETRDCTAFGVLYSSDRTILLYIQ